MITQQVTFSILKINKIWFGEAVKFSPIREYKQATFNCKQFGYQKSSFFTKLIDLRAGQEVLKSPMSKTMKYKIRRAKREGVIFEKEKNNLAIIPFYNEFAKTNNNLTAIDTKYIASINPNLVVTKAVIGNEPLVMHGYIVDRKIGRVRLLFSASQPRSKVDADKNALLGRANRFLHFEDMLYFKAENFDVYDFGGYAKDTTDQALQGINRFKDGFGGVLIEEFDYTPLWIASLRKVKEMLRKKIRV